MQVCASRKWKCRSSDIKNAFGQAMKTNRQQKLAASLPSGLQEAGFDVLELDGTAILDSVVSHTLVHLRPNNVTKQV